MQEWLQEKTQDGITNEDAFREALIEYGRKGNIQAIKEAFDRAFGKAKEKVELDANINISDVSEEQIKQMLKRS